VVYSVGSHGELTQASQVVGFAGVPWNMAVDKTCSYVYLSDTASANIYAFQYAGGFLSDLPGSPFPAGSAVLGKGLFGLSGDPAGRFLYVANQTEGKLYGFVIGSDGGLVPVPGSALPVGTTPVATLAVSVSSTSFLYVTDTTANNIASYRIDSNTGALSASSSATTRPGPQYLNSSGSLLFSANVQDSSIDAFHLNGDGTMTRVPGSPFALTSQPLGAAVVVTGRN
jgi:6-phosphogluconolactonase (cycloisomerase 2 family)